MDTSRLFAEGSIHSTIPDSILYELAPPLRVNGRPAVCAHLRELVRNPWYRFGKRSAQLERAYMLCALNHHIASRLISDVGIVPKLPTVKRWKRQTEPRSLRVPPHTLKWGGVDATRVRPLPLTRQYLSTVSQHLVRTALSWAPPVVAPKDKSGCYRVVANHVPALLVWQLIPDQEVPVRLLKHRTALARTLPDICAGLTFVMSPRYEMYKARVAVVAEKLPDAHVLSGYSRSWSSELIRESKKLERPDDQSGA